jgi:hypothetical protein
MDQILSPTDLVDSHLTLLPSLSAARPDPREEIFQLQVYNCTSMEFGRSYSRM